MVNLSAIAGVASAVKSIYELSKTALELHDAAMIRAKVLEMQGEISAALASAITAQTDQMAMLEEVRELKAEVTRLKNWETEKQRYELKQVGHIGGTAYVIKPAMQGAEPIHCICPACYERANKYILQPQPGAPRVNTPWACPECKSVVIVDMHILNPPETQA
ncbi:MAG: hypothetical protein ACHQRJ_05790 [Alphaproteobacteria bacterium]